MTRFQTLALWLLWPAMLTLLPLRAVCEQNKHSTGSIVFTCNQGDEENGNRELCRFTWDAKQQRITNNGAFDGFPSVSLDSRVVAFYSTRDGKGEIYTAKRDGSTVRQVTRSGARVSSDPSLSADGSLLAFESNRDGDFKIYLLDLRHPSRKPLQITQGGGSPALRPDGKQVAYAAGNQRGQSAIYLVNANGLGNHMLCLGDEPNFAPTGRRIVFNLRGRIGVVNRDGTGFKLLSPPGSGDSQPAFSPDGKDIVFCSLPSDRSARANALEGRFHQELYIMKADGSGARRITFKGGAKASPVWIRTPAVSYVAPPTPKPTPAPRIAPQTPPANNPLVQSSPAFSGRLIYAFNDLQKAPYSSFLLENAGGKRAAFRLRGLQGTEGDFVFDPQILPNGSEVLVKLGDPVARPGNPYNSYRLWKWNRSANDFKRVGARPLFFPLVAVSPDSRRVAYVGGGDAEGTATAENPLRLYVCDLQTGKETLVAQNDGVRGGFAWQGESMLLYTTLPPAEAPADTPPSIRPNILSFDVSTSQSRLLIQDGSHPAPSPDGKRIAFFGLREGEKIYPLSDEWWLRPGIAALSVVGSDGEGRKSYGARSGPFPQLFWTPDSERLIFIRETASSPRSNANISQWNVVNDDVRSVADLSTRDKQEVERPWSNPQFRGLSLSPDAKSLFVSVEKQITSSTTIHNLQTLDLQNGKVTVVARLKNDQGFSWKP